jgi:hypothetical protein
MNEVNMESKLKERELDDDVFGLRLGVWIEGLGGRFLR